MAYKRRKGLFEKVYKVIRTVPEGKVVTYGQLAKIVGTRDARKIGWALHANPDEKNPCHRVVNKEGRLAPNFAFGGSDEQRSRLVSEGVAFVDKMHVDLEKSQWESKRK